MIIFIYTYIIIIIIIIRFRQCQDNYRSSVDYRDNSFYITIILIKTVVVPGICQRVNI